MRACPTENNLVLISREVSYKLKTIPFPMLQRACPNIPEKSSRMNLPEGMSKNAWKKLQKKQRWEEQKETYRKRRREKKLAARKRKAEMKINGGTESTPQGPGSTKRSIPLQQESTDVTVIMDCDFDDLMNDKEIVSLSNQITRCYSAMRHSTHKLELTISSFNRRLRERFEGSLPDYAKWRDIEFMTNTSLDEIIPNESGKRSQYVYLTADTDEELTELQSGVKYIVGGIVDKNRHKKLCLEKAEKLGIKAARLPIGKYIHLNGRQVLATSHVFEIMCMWFEKGGNWEEAFNTVLPPRKLNFTCENRLVETTDPKVEVADEPEK